MRTLILLTALTLSGCKSENGLEDNNTGACACDDGQPGEQGPAGDAGPAGEAGADGAAGPQGEPGQACWDLNGDGSWDVDEDVNGDGVVDVGDCVPEDALYHARTVVTIWKDLDKDSCANDEPIPHLVREECCPDGFVAIGSELVGGETLVVCVEETRTGKTVVEVEYNLDGLNCYDADQPELCCPDGFTPHGYNSGQDVICIED